MRILALTRYNTLGASSRVRFFQYLSYLRSCGVDLQLAPLLDDDYVIRLYSAKSQSIFSIGRAYIYRVVQLMNSRSFDLLWIEKELFPWFPPWAESLLAGLGVPMVLDYDDAVFHRYDMHRNPLIRVLIGNKIESIMHHATSVVVGNDYLAEHARHAGAAKIEYLPSVVDIDRYFVCKRRDSGDFRIGWIGSPVTAPYLGLIREALEIATRQENTHLVLVGAGKKDPLPDLDKVILPWSEIGEVGQIQSFDVGIMPLPDGPFEVGKCGYKLIQYMACGLPVIASPIGVNSHIVEQGKTGILASSTSQWVQALDFLFKNPSLRSQMGEAGRLKAEKEYSLQGMAPRLMEILSEAVTHKNN
jgi:glycosyltransferase involved in cell wall biosynthesis